jgi:Cys-tRNA(Pro)/Cys-tRNA(Cys) deacylase
MGKETKTNAMRILDKQKISYRLNQYECDEFIDGVHIADKLGQSYDVSFKTIVTVGKSGGYYVFALPVDKEIDLKKAARVVGEKNLELLPVKDINKVTGYIRGGCTPVGMKKQFPTVIHESARELDEIIVSGGRLGEQIMLAPQDLVKVVNGKFGDVVKNSYTVQ